MTSCNHYHPTVVNYCAIGQCVGPCIAEELQAIGPYLRAVGMYQKDVNVACGVPLPDMRQTALRVNWNIELAVCSIGVVIRVCVELVIRHKVCVPPSSSKDPEVGRG